MPCPFVWVSTGVTGKAPRTEFQTHAADDSSSISNS